MRLIPKIMTIALLVVIASCSIGVYATWHYASTNDIVDQEQQVDMGINDFIYYNEVVIKNVVKVSSTMANDDTSYAQPTTVNSTLTGNSGQKAVYKVLAHNYSTTDTFIFAGISSADTNKVNVSVSYDEENQNRLSTDLSANYQQGTPVAPGEDFVFYITYTLTKNLSVSDVIVNYVFKPIIYTVTYLHNNETFAEHYVTNNEVVYNVTTEKPTQSGVSFAGWINVNAVVINSISAGNTHDYTLSASWDKIYVIIFADTQGNVLYQEQFTSSSTGLSSEGQATVDRILAELNAEAAKEHMSVSWSEYEIKGAKGDIMVKAISAYNGDLNLVPVYEAPDDGIVDYYQVEAVDALDEEVVVPGSVGGVPVRVIVRLANKEGENDWNNYAKGVKSVIIGEGVERLEWNSLAWTPDLVTVKLPSTIEYLAKNTFSRNDLFGNDKKVLTIEFNGTKAEWKRIISNSDKAWDGGLQDGSVVRCIDGYFELDKGLFSSSWKEKNY